MKEEIGLNMIDDFSRLNREPTRQAPQIYLIVSSDRSLLPPGGTANLVIFVNTDQDFFVTDLLNRVVFSSSLGGSLSVDNNGNPVDGTVTAKYTAPKSATGADRIIASILGTAAFITVIIRDFDDFEPMQVDNGLYPQEGEKDSGVRMSKSHDYE